MLESIWQKKGDKPTSVSRVFVSRKRDKDRSLRSKHWDSYEVGGWERSTIEEKKTNNGKKNLKNGQ